MKQKRLVDVLPKRLPKLGSQRLGDAFRSLTSVGDGILQSIRRFNVVALETGRVCFKIPPDPLAPSHVVGPKVVIGHDVDLQELQALGHRITHSVPSVDLPVSDVQEALELREHCWVFDVGLRHHLVALPVQDHLADIPAWRQLLHLLVRLRGCRELRQVRGVEAIRRDQGPLEAARVLGCDRFLQLTARDLIRRPSNRGGGILAVQQLCGHGTVQQSTHLGVVRTCQSRLHLRRDLRSQIHGLRVCLSLRLLNPFLRLPARPRSHHLVSLGQSLLGCAQSLVQETKSTGSGAMLRVLQHRRLGRRGRLPGHVRRGHGQGGGVVLHPE
mmetsp:Transcript_153849/g.493416  ORF Transcript_153849/g.493416 Transcript_153849/m.493416 type:complete len:328 (+) Transcript_153849:1010-1993(+)